MPHFSFTTMNSAGFRFAMSTHPHADRNPLSRV
jgi:hypothetical protein